MEDARQTEEERRRKLERKKVAVVGRRILSGWHSLVLSRQTYGDLPPWSHILPRKRNELPARSVPFLPFKLRWQSLCRRALASSYRKILTTLLYQCLCSLDLGDLADTNIDYEVCAMLDKTITYIFFEYLKNRSRFVRFALYLNQVSISP